MTTQAALKEILTLAASAVSTASADDLIACHAEFEAFALAAVGYNSPLNAEIHDVDPSGRTLPEMQRVYSPVYDEPSAEFSRFVDVGRFFKIFQRIGANPFAGGDKRGARFKCGDFYRNGYSPIQTANEYVIGSAETHRLLNAAAKRSNNAFHGRAKA